MSHPSSPRVSYRHFSTDFKLEVLSYYYSSGESKQSVSRHFNIHRRCLKNWLEKYPLSEISVLLPPETVNRLESMSHQESHSPVSVSPEARMAELEAENARLKERVSGLQAALEYSELRVEAFSLAIKYYDEQEGVDILKKAGSRQQ